MLELTAPGFEFDPDLELLVVQFCLFSPFSFLPPPKKTSCLLSIATRSESGTMVLGIISRSGPGSRDYSVMEEKTTF